MFDLLGVEWDLSEDLFQKLQDFTCQVYNSRPGTNSANELRYRMFCSRRGNIESDQLPPCADCLYKHACRADYQIAIWIGSLENCPEIPSPLRHGWTQDENKLGIDLTSDQPAPTAVLELLSCSCTRSGKLLNCSCFLNGKMCRHPECKNRREEAVVVDVDAQIMTRTRIKMSGPNIFTLFLLAANMINEDAKYLQNLFVKILSISVAELLYTLRFISCQNKGIAL